MRPRFVHMICGCALLLAAPAIRAQVSEQMRAKIKEALPKFSPPPPEPKTVESTVGLPAPLPDENVVRLPDFLVVDRSAPGTEPDKWLTKQGVDRKALKEYKDSMTSFDWALNSFYIPLPFGLSLTPSPLARARADYAEKRTAAEMREFSDIVNAVAHIDPVYARKLARDADLNRHPGD